MNSFTYTCGIDVSKDSLDIQKMEINNPANFSENCLSNRSAAIEDWVKTMDKTSTLYVLEATGSYSSTLLYYLSRYEIPVMVVAPHQSKAFMQALGMSNKNDRQAAHALALMGKTMPVRLYRAPCDNMLKQKQFITALGAMKKQQRMLLNQLHALDQLPFVEPSVRQAYEQSLQTVEQQIERLEQQLEQTEEKNDEDFELAIKYAVSVKSIGRKTARAMLLVTNCFEDFDCDRQVSKFLGVTPRSHYSGSSVRKKGRITKMGPAFVRALLYNCTRSAIRFNPACKELFQRLRKNGKPYKVAAVAVVHKLIKQVFACVKKQQMFDPEFHLNKNTQAAN